MKIGECCNREVIVADKDTEVLDAARLMKEHHVGDVVIVEKRDGATRPAGILTDRDLVVEVMAQEVPPNEVTAADVMSLEITTVREDEGVWETLEKMRDAGVRRMPVVDQDGSLVGLVTLDDLLDLFTEALDNMTRLIKGELRRESRQRKA
ncbi:MAG TPA: CBS domain-containing protein [Arenicellales bacterium]|nr:CBS domain-containing protein [Arenicellales bacterium]